MSCSVDDRPSASALDARVAPAWGIAKQDLSIRQHGVLRYEQLQLIVALASRFWFCNLICRAAIYKQTFVFSLNPFDISVQ